MGMVVEQVNAAKAQGREVFVLGESMGAGVALHAATRSGASPPDGVVLVSPATGWDRTWVGRSRHFLVDLPDSLLGLATLFTSYQLLDVEQLWTTAARCPRRALTAPRHAPPTGLAVAPRRRDARGVCAARGHRPTPHCRVDGADARHRPQGDLLGLRPSLVLIVAGTADLRVPARRSVAPAGLRERAL